MNTTFEVIVVSSKSQCLDYTERNFLAFSALGIVPFELMLVYLRFHSIQNCQKLVMYEQNCKISYNPKNVPKISVAFIDLGLYWSITTTQRIFSNIDWYLKITEGYANEFSIRYWWNLKLIFHWNSNEITGDELLMGAALPVNILIIWLILTSFVRQVKSY